MPGKTWFSPELRTASVVPRWSIVWTLTRDTVANHSFFVALYADQIARLIGWSNKGNGGPWPGALMYLALTHDLDELATGDIVAPAKREILDTDKADAFIQQNMKERLPDVVGMTEHWRAVNLKSYLEAKLIIKVADRLDALIFLVIEQRLGNTVIGPRIPECWASLREAWNKLMEADPDRGQKPFFNVIVPAVEAHRTTGGYGI